MRKRQINIYFLFKVEKMQIEIGIVNKYVNQSS